MAVDINWNPKHNWRLRWHLQTPTGGLTDPNGLCQWNGVYHFYHQYTPKWPAVGHGWGHWSSPDLLTWTFHGEDIRPDCDLDRNGSYSGSAIVKNNKLWCYYTGNVLLPGDYDYDYKGRLANENLTITDDGIHYTQKVRVLGNESYPAYCSCHVRDPKVWQEDDGNYYMLLGCRTMDDRGCVLMYRSFDGLKWEFAGSATNREVYAFGYMWECPNVAKVGDKEFLFICPQGCPKKPFKFQNIHNAGYYPVDGKVVDILAQDPDKMNAAGPYRCFNEDDFVENDYGFDYYAPQVFKDESGRTIIVGWISLPDVEFQYDLPTREWMHTLTAPRVMTLNEAGRICFWPVKELEGLRERQVEFSLDNASGATGYIGSSHYDMFNIDNATSACFPNGTADVLIENIEGTGRLIIGNDLELIIFDSVAELDFQGPSGRWRTNRRLPLSELSAGKIHDLRIMVDTSVVEIYINGGEKTMTTRWYPLDITNLHITSTIKADYIGWELGAYTFKNVG